jgi:hypothetical protein
MILCSASPMSGSDRPMTANNPARDDGDPSSFVTSTNNRLPATYIGREVVSCHIDSPSGFMASVIICP